MFKFGAIDHFRFAKGTIITHVNTHKAQRKQESSHEVPLKAPTGSSMVQGHETSPRDK